MQSDEERCRVMQKDARSCREIWSNVEKCKVMRSDTCRYGEMRIDIESFGEVESHAEQCRFLKQYASLEWRNNDMKYNKTSKNPKIFPCIICSTKTQWIIKNDSSLDIVPTPIHDQMAAFLQCCTCTYCKYLVRFMGKFFLYRYPLLVDFFWRFFLWVTSGIIGYALLRTLLEDSSLHSTICNILKRIFHFLSERLENVLINCVIWSVTKVLFTLQMVIQKNDTK